MKRAMTISYEVGDSLYLNLTNKCPCSCTFCIRNNADGAFGSDPLWLEHEPTLEEIKDDLSKRSLSSYPEIVFCGYGEPTERLDTLLKVAAYLRSQEGCPKLRINTNGLGNLVNGRDITGELCSALDVISVSLNAASKDEYLALTRPRYPEAFEAMQQFISDCVKTGQAEVVTTVVDCIPQEQIDAARALSEQLGARLRVRAYEEPKQA